MCRGMRITRPRFLRQTPLSFGPKTGFGAPLSIDPMITAPQGSSIYPRLLVVVDVVVVIFSRARH